MVAGVVRGEDPAVLGEAVPIDRYAKIPAVPFYGKHQAASACNGDGRHTPAAVPAARYCVDGWP